MTIIIVRNEGTMKRAEELEYVALAEVKARLSERVRAADRRGRRFAITVHGRPKAVLIGYGEYLSLVENAEEPEPREIAIDRWRRERKARRRVVESVTSRFDASRLRRKGRKGYKRDVVG
jgi:prevent-host-death family protein